MPRYYTTKVERTAAEQLVQYLQKNTNIKVVFPKQALIAAKRENPNLVFYHKLDTHWNNAGAYVAADCLANALGMDLPDINKISFEEYRFSSSDLTNMIGMPIKDASTDYCLSGYGENDTVLKAWDYNSSIIYQTEEKYGNLYVIRDSFSSALAPHLSTLFRNSYYVLRGAYNQQQIFDYDADTVVLEIVERDIYSLTNFKISYISSTIETIDGMKNIIISPAIEGRDLSKVSIFKNKSNTETTEVITLVETLNEPVCIKVPEQEKGEIQVHVFDNQNANNEIEEVTISY